MEVGEIITIATSIDPCGRAMRDRQFEILKVYEKKIKEQDLILCKNLEIGTRECFQRFDILKKLGLITEEKIGYKASHHKGPRLPFRSDDEWGDDDL